MEKHDEHWQEEDPLNPAIGVFGWSAIMAICWMIVYLIYRAVAS